MNIKRVITISLLCFLTLFSISFSFAEGKPKETKEEKINREKRENKANELQKYIDEFKEEENKKIIEKLLEESKTIIRNLGILKENYLVGKITNEDFDKILNECEEIKKEIKIKEVNDYILKFNNNESFVFIEAKCHLSEESKTIINNLEKTIKDYLHGNITEEDLDKILDKCKKIEKELQKNINNWEMNIRHGVGVYTQYVVDDLQRWIEKFDKEENKEIIEKLPEKSRNIIKNLEIAMEDYNIYKIIKKDFEKVLNECKEIKEEIDICKLQTYIEEFKKEENKEIMEKRLVKREDTINNLEAIKKKYLVGFITDEILDNVLNKCKVINSKIDNKKAKKEK